MAEFKTEALGDGIHCAVSRAHTFGTDSFLLSAFCEVKRKDIACDFCSGCGIVPLLWMRGENAPQRVYALDIQEEAVRQLEQSCALSGLSPERFIVLHGDLREKLPQLAAGSLDLISCNPPYKALGTGLQSGDESRRIARHETMCEVDDVCAAAARLLKFGGRLCLCQLTERLVDVLDAMRRHGLEPKRIRFVQKNAHSAPWLFLVEGKRGGKPFMRTLPPVLMDEYDVAGSFDGKM